MGVAELGEIIRAGLYVPDRALLDKLMKVAVRQGWVVTEVLWQWPEVLAALAGREVDRVLMTSLRDLPPGRAPRIIGADELRPPRDPRRQRWRPV